MSKRTIDKLITNKERAADLHAVKRRIDVLQRRYVSKTYKKEKYAERLVNELEELINVFVQKLHEAKKESDLEVH